MKEKKSKKIRLAKFLAEAGVASRRKSEELIKAGKIKVDDKIVDNVATTVYFDHKNIKVNDRPVFLENKVYYLLNKPLGYISSVKDPHNAKIIVDLVPKRPPVWPVGRLDKDSKGLILLTNDGELTYKLTHPKFEVQKTYLVKVNKDLDKNIFDKLKKGIKLEEGLAKADKLKKISSKELEIVIHQGWKRQIRRMFKALGYQVESLTRIKEGKLSLGDLALGKYKKLNLKDII